MHHSRSFTTNSSTSNPVPDRCSPVLATEAAKLLIGCYRRDDAANADIFATALVSVFCEYSEAIVRHVSDPRTGVPGKQKWFPSIAEVKEECDKVAERIQKAVDWQKREDRRLGELPAPIVNRAASMARIKAAYPEVFAKVAQSDRAKALAELVDRCAALGIDPGSLKDRPGYTSPERLVDVAGRSF